MSEEKPPERLISFTPDQLKLGFIEKGGPVTVKLIGFEKEAGLTPGIGVMMVLTPTEARRFAEDLIRVAGKAEAGLPRA